MHKPCFPGVTSFLLGIYIVDEDRSYVNVERINTCKLTTHLHNNYQVELLGQYMRLDSTHLLVNGLVV